MWLCILLLEPNNHSYDKLPVDSEIQFPNAKRPVEVADPVDPTPKTEPVALNADEIVATNPLGTASAGDAAQRNEPGVDRANEAAESPKIGTAGLTWLFGSWNCFLKKA